MRRFLLKLSAVLPVLGIVTAMIAGWLTPGYASIAQQMSELELLGGPAAFATRAGSLVTGLSIVAFAIALLTSKSWRMPFTAGTALVFGVSMMANGIFIMGSPLHGMYGIGLASILTPACYAAESRRPSAGHHADTFSLLAAVLNLIYMWLLMTGLDPAASHGLTQRLACISLFGWFSCASIQLLECPSRRPSSDGEPVNAAHAPIPASQAGRSTTQCLGIGLCAFIFASFSMLPSKARAIVVRENVPDAAYLVPESAFPALVDLPGEGHGTLIAKQWVLTAAHPTIGYKLDHVTIGGKARAVKEVIRYPGFRKLEAVSMSGDAAPLMAELTAKDDIALIHLVDPVEDVVPVAVYRQSDEQGRLAEMYGKGATGNGRTGEYPGSSHRGSLRRAYNVITVAHGRWLDYNFDCSAHALSLEGVMGDGDSGGPVLIQTGRQWRLAGLTSWKHWQGDLSTFKAGVCGQTFSNVRVSHYLKWIDQVIGAHSGW